MANTSSQAADPQRPLSPPCRVCDAPIMENAPRIEVARVTADGQSETDTLCRSCGGELAGLVDALRYARARQLRVGGRS